MKFCPQPSRVIRDHARCSLLVSGSSQFLRDTISVFFRPRVCFQDLAPTLRSTRILEKHLRFILFSYLCHYQKRERGQPQWCQGITPTISSSPGSDVTRGLSFSSCTRFFFGRSDFSLSSKPNISGIWQTRSYFVDVLYVE